MVEKNFIKKQDVLKVFKKKYKIDITNSTLLYYSGKKLIKAGRLARDEGVRGSVSYYKENTPDLIYTIKYFLDEKKFSLEELRKNLMILNFEDVPKLNVYYETIFKSDGYKVFFEKEKIKVSKSMWEFVDFVRIASYIALMELGIVGKDSERYFDEDSIRAYIEKSKSGEFSIVVEFIKTFGKRVTFKEGGALVEDIK